MNERERCPLCESFESQLFCEDRRREYLRCGNCALVFVPPQYVLTNCEEKAEYDRHENSVDDPRYRGFLNRLAEPLLARLPLGAEGLDFGCGPGPALAHMLRESGHSVDLYDPYYFPEDLPWDKNFDFICATEVVEHLYRPGAELTRLWSLLRDGGVLGIMTKLVIDAEAFARWHYKNDPTHVCFFSRTTMLWLSDQLGADCQFIGADVILMTKR